METGRISEGAGGSPGFVSSVSDKGEIRSVLVTNHIAHRGRQNHPLLDSGSGFSLRFSRDLAGSEDPSPGPSKPPKGTGSADHPFGRGEHPNGRPGSGVYWP